jgi:hypothetical protein
LDVWARNVRSSRRRTSGAVIATRRMRSICQGP